MLSLLIEDKSGQAVLGGADTGYRVHVRLLLPFALSSPQASIVFDRDMGEHLEVQCVAQQRMGASRHA